MTHATKAIYRLLLTDYIGVSRVSVEELFTEQDIENSMNKSRSSSSARRWKSMESASGATQPAMSSAQRCLWWTLLVFGFFIPGDYSTEEEDRHIPAAEVPQFSPDVCIIESLEFKLMSRDTCERSDSLNSSATRFLKAELLLILEEYWSKHPELHSVNIYYASSLAQRCMKVYQTFVNSMKDNGASDHCFDFKNISYLKSINNFSDVGPSVVMASPGYVVEGTLAKTIINEPKEVTLMSGMTVPLKIKVHSVSFSAHADSVQTSKFLKSLMPPNIILVHGEANEMERLKQKLATSVFAAGNTKIITPKNCQSVEIFFTSEKMVKVFGKKLAGKRPEVSDTVSGLLVKKGFTNQIMAPVDDDVHVKSQLSTATVTQRITIPYSGGFALIKHRLKQIYQRVEASTDEELGVPTLRVHDQVTVKQERSKNGHISLHWVADPVSDMVADSIVALVLNANRETPKVGFESGPPVTAVDDAGPGKAKKLVHSLLVSLFGDVKSGENGKLIITVDDSVALLDQQSGEVECKSEAFKGRVKTAFQRIQSAVKPIPPLSV
ncbi:OLC1v1036446C1 [Oldenlandia corymbosa var. corymbosa]|uniref:OLC1v1036446C1 n=1 Tax=Oldenlandia corymbosa var. corymbosa TaxID=529605 RepID=A0AAV1CYJ4_OLDCO|nr:OLC1v1036446C1 [Oldenlandia corymbosa var. corymbosa]